MIATVGFPAAGVENEPVKAGSKDMRGSVMDVVCLARSAIRLRGWSAQPANRRTECLARLGAYPAKFQRAAIGFEGGDACSVVQQGRIACRQELRGPLGSGPLMRAVAGCEHGRSWQCRSYA